MEEKVTYDNTEEIEIAEVSDVRPQSKGRAVAHSVSTIIVTVLATVAFLFFAVFASAMIESYFDMQDHVEGSGINGGAIGYAFALVFMIVTTVAVVPLSIAGIILSATSVKFRQGVNKVIGIVMLVLNSFYLVADVVLMVVAILIGNAS